MPLVWVDTGRNQMTASVRSFFRFVFFFCFVFFFFVCDCSSGFHTTVALLVQVAKRISIDSSDGSTAGGDEVEAMALTREGGVIFGFECADVAEKDAWLTAVHSVTSFASPEADGSDDGAGAPGGEVDDSCVIL